MTRAPMSHGLFVMPKQWEGEVMEDGLPLRHLGKYQGREMAAYAMRQMGMYLPMVMIWDSFNRKVVAGLVQPQEAVTAMQNDPSSPVAIEYALRVPGSTAYRRKHYQASEFVRLLEQNQLPLQIDDMQGVYLNDH